MWGRFIAHQDLQTVLRCHIAAFEALGGVPAEILYDRMKTAVLGEVDDQGIATIARSSRCLEQLLRVIMQNCSKGGTGSVNPRSDLALSQFRCTMRAQDVDLTSARPEREHHPDSAAARDLQKSLTIPFRGSSWLVVPKA
jgi:hypothetical protein